MSDKPLIAVRAKKETRPNPHVEDFPDQAKEIVSFTFVCPECRRQETSPQPGLYPSLCGAQLEINEEV